MNNKYSHKNQTAFSKNEYSHIGGGGGEDVGMSNPEEKMSNTGNTKLVSRKKNWLIPGSRNPIPPPPPPL